MSSDYTSLGKKIGEMEVIISYRIIDLFSGHLYSSPVKAIEELVVNSYDAFARNCYVVIPSDLEDPNSKFTVFDDGEGMDETGIRELWLIADTQKRKPEREDEARKKGRLPVGKFGIGKLASYVIGTRISHISKKNGRYFAVTMDYKVLEERKEKTNYILPIHEVTKEEAQNIFRSEGIEKYLLKEPQAWTLVIINGLKPRAREIKVGRLEWIISTALPLVPDFKCFLNEKVIVPRKLQGKRLNDWIIGKDDKSAESLKYRCLHNATASPEYCVDVPEIGPISGNFELFEDTITTGKSEEIGRSNGFFIMVRGRLINEEKPYFGLPILSHATFNRFRAVVNADGLDKYLVVNREDVSSVAHEYLESYLSKKFYEVRDWYETYQEEHETEYPEDLNQLPTSLIKYPLVHALDRVEQEGLTPYSVKAPNPKERMQTNINEVRLEALDPSSPVAILDVNAGIIKANSQHPFRNNFEEERSYTTWAIAEVMLEVYMLESGIAENTIQSIMKKRDRLLRVLVQKGPRPVNIVSSMLTETCHIQDTFEIACGDAFAILGMEVTRLGGTGKPEGVAIANLGVDREGKTLTYKLVYDAKSTTKDKVKATNLNISSANRHREDWKTNYAVIIAPEFEGGEDSAARKEAKQLNVTLIRAQDLSELVKYSAIKSLSLRKLRDFFDKCRTPEESHEWIMRFKEEKRTIPPIRTLLCTIWDLQRVNPKDPPSFGAIKQKNLKVFKEFSEVRDIAEWLRALSRLVPNLIYVSDEGYVILEQKPEIVIERIVATIKELGLPAAYLEITKAIEE